MKRGPCPPSLHSFFMELNEEALLKVSLENLYWFQSYKKLLFQKWSKKSYQKLKIPTFCCILGNHFIGLFYSISQLSLLLIVPEKLKETCSNEIEQDRNRKSTFVQNNYSGLCAFFHPVLLLGSPEYSCMQVEVAVCNP